MAVITQNSDLDTKKSLVVKFCIPVLNSPHNFDIQSIPYKSQCKMCRFFTFTTTPEAEGAWLLSRDCSWAVIGLCVTLVAYSVRSSPAQGSLITNLGIENVNTNQLIGIK